jgi:general secretion pathway protein A
MFLEFYGLQEQPFGVTPDPRFFFLSQSHREALASLYYSIEAKRGFSALVAEPGMGKTSIIFRVMESLKSTMRTAFLFQTQGTDSRSFLRSILNDAGIPCDNEEDVSLMRELLNEVLLEEASAGRRFVLFVDEAQNLEGEVLESVRLLSNFETPTAKLMHIVLAGQPALSEKLARPEMVQLKQRVASMLQLFAFSLRETTNYVQHRLQVAGYKGSSLFTSQSMELITRYSEGIPRNINSICFQALSLGFANGARTIDVEIVREVLADLKIKTGDPQSLPSLPQWPIPELPGLSDFKSSEGRRTRSWRGSRIAALSSVVLVMFLLAVFGSPILGGTSPSEFAARICGIVLGPSSVWPSDLPNVPARLKVPTAPQIALEKSVESPIKQEIIPTDHSKESDGKPEHDLPRDRNRTRSVASVERGSKVVWAQRSETIFQVAMEYYGKADVVTVYRIRQMNPQIKDTYAVIREGQRIVLPGVPIGETGKAESRASLKANLRRQ